MAIKTYRPTTQTLRYRTSVTTDDITSSKPHKPLVEGKIRSGGRRNSGDTTMRFRAAATSACCAPSTSSATSTAFRRPSSPSNTIRPFGAHRLVELRRWREALHRAAGRAKGRSENCERPEADILVGNALPLRNIPPGTTIHNVELKPGKGAQMVRSAGGSAQLIAKEGDYGLVKLPSGETRKVMLDCLATIGQVGNTDHENVTWGKADARAGWKASA